MTIEKAIEILIRHNKWRRGDEETELVKPEALGNAMDVVVSFFDKLFTGNGESNKDIGSAVVLLKEQIFRTEVKLMESYGNYGPYLQSLSKEFKENNENEMSKQVKEYRKALHILTSQDQTINVPG